MGDKAIILLSEEEADKILSELQPDEKQFFEQLAKHIIKSESKTNEVDSTKKGALYETDDIWRTIKGKNEHGTKW